MAALKTSSALIPPGPAIFLVGGARTKVLKHHLVDGRMPVKNPADGLQLLGLIEILTETGATAAFVFVFCRGMLGVASFLFMQWYQLVGTFLMSPSGNGRKSLAFRRRLHIPPVRIGSALSPGEHRDETYQRKNLTEAAQREPFQPTKHMVLIRSRNNKTAIFISKTINH